MIACAEVALRDHPLTVKIIELFVGHSDLFYFSASLASIGALIYARRWGERRAPSKLSKK